jgi:hypothetical protein
VWHIKQERNICQPVHPCMHGWPMGQWFWALQKSNAKDLVISLPLVQLRFCWKLFVVALCRVCASLTSPTLSLFVSIPPPWKFKRSQIQVTFCSKLLWAPNGERSGNT